ncbi:UNVERIFIED_CONTAM: hypothetical protein GTU68_008326 [Idotea baltica]|nr:hypothetical protein [Idotea baltica]
MFERMQCQHPYIVFKDIEPKEMELLLDYMYKGEVNVVQEMLPTLIKAAEALRVKGLAVPDEMPSGKDYSTGRKRSNSSNDSPQAKRKSEEVKKGTQGLNDPIRTEETEGAVSSNIEESNSGNDPTSFSLYETNAEANVSSFQESF